MVQRRRIDGGGGEEQSAHHVLGYQPGQVGGRSQRSALDLRQSERRIVGGDDHVGVTHQADPAADTEAVHRRDHRDRAFVDRLERGEAAPVGVDQRGEAGGALHLLDVDTGVEAASLGPQDHRVGGGVPAGVGDRVGQVEPAAGRDRVDRWIVDGHSNDAGFDGPRRDCHGTPGAGHLNLSKHLLGTLTQCLARSVSAWTAGSSW